MNKRTENRDYIVHIDVKTLEKSIIIVDSDTGRLNTGSRWSHGIHEFLEVKHGISPKNESFTAASISHPSFFNDYNKIYGLTGTIGTDFERKKLKETYNIDTFNVPPHYLSNKKTLPVKIVLF